MPPYKVFTSRNLGRLISTLFVVIALVCIVVYSLMRSGDEEDAAKSSAGAGGAKTTSGGRTRGKRDKQKSGMMGLQTKRGESTVPVQISRVAHQRIEEFRHATCNLEAEKEVSVVAKTSDLITEILVEEGDSVKEGQVLAKIDDERAKMASEQARVRYENAKTELERAKQTYDKGISSDEAYQSARLQYDTAKIDHEQRELELKYTSIKAPFDGIITSRRIEIGDHVSVNQDVFTIADLDPLLARIYLPETEWNNIKVGHTTRVTVDALAGREFVGRVQRISPIVEKETGTFKVTVEIHDKENLLRPGMLAKVFVITDSRDNAFVIPKKALVLESENDEVFVLKDYVKFALSQRTAERISVGDAVELKVEHPEHEVEGGKTPSPASKQGKPGESKPWGAVSATPPGPPKTASGVPSQRPSSPTEGSADKKGPPGNEKGQSSTKDGSKPKEASASGDQGAPPSKKGNSRQSSSFPSDQTGDRKSGPPGGRGSWQGKRTGSGQSSGGRGSKGGSLASRRPGQSGSGKPQDPTADSRKPKPGATFIGTVYDVKMNDPDPETGKITVVFEIGEMLLSSIDPDAQTELDNKEIPRRLRMEIRKRGLPISHAAAVSIEEKGKRWLITDDSSGQTYVVRKDKDALNLYARKDETGLQSEMRMSGEVTPTDEAKAVRIPPGAIETETKAFKKRIKLGFDESDPVEILEGIALDERIITVGHEDLREGTAVTVVGEEALIAKAKEKEKERKLAKETSKPPTGGMRRGGAGRPGPEQIKMFLKMRVGDPQFQEGLLKIEKIKKEYDEKLKADASLATDAEKRKAFFTEMLDKHITEILEALRKMRGASRGRGGPRQ